MGRVRRVAPVDPTERDDVDGRLLRLHRPDLRRRGLGPQHRLVVEEERRERRARGMAGREVERVEVVAGRLDLAAVDDAVAEPEEDVLDLAPDLRDQVEPPSRVAADRQRDVDALLAESPVELRPRELRLARVDGRLDPLAHGVEAHARLAVAHLAQRELELALASEVLDPHAPRSRPSSPPRRPQRGPPARAPGRPSDAEGISTASGVSRLTVTSWVTTTPLRRSTTASRPG